MRLAEKRADHRIVTVRLVHCEAAEMIEFAAKRSRLLGQRPIAERRSAIDDHPRRLALGMRVDDAHRAQSFAPRHDAYQARNVLNRRCRQTFLGRAQDIEGIEVQRVFLMPLEASSGA